MNTLDPTYPIDDKQFSRTGSLFCLSIRQIVHVLVAIDLIFASSGLCYDLTCLIIDQLSQMEMFQSNELLQYLRHIPMGIFFDNLILFRSFWTIDFISKYFFSILYLHILLNVFAIVSSISMLMAIKSHQLCGGIAQWLEEIKIDNWQSRWRTREIQVWIINNFLGLYSFGFFFSVWNRCMDKVIGFFFRRISNSSRWVCWNSFGKCLHW